jgi:hypothetical protein
MGVERFAKRIAEQPRKANKPVMPSPCGTSWDRAILTGSFDQQKFHKAIYRHLYHDIGILHGKCALEQLTGIKALDPPIFLGILIASRESPAIPLLPAYLRSFAGVSYRRYLCPTRIRPLQDSSLALPI